VNRIERQRRAQGAAARRSGTRALSTLTAGLAVAGSVGVGAVAWSAHQAQAAKAAAAATSQSSGAASTSSSSSSSSTSNPNAVVTLPPVSSIGTQTTTLQPAQQAPQPQNVPQQPQAVGSGS
jgi:hypothetical protein